MPLGLIPLLLGWSTAVGLWCWGTFVFYEMLGEVNGRSRSEDRIDASWASSVLFEVVRRHRQLYPSSRLRRRMVILYAAGFLLAVITTVIGVAINTD